jgi:hypothetical protein
MKLIFAFLIVLVVSTDISATGQISVTTSPYIAAVFVPRIDNSYYLLGINTIDYNQPAMMLITSINRTPDSNSSQDKLAITVSVSGTVGLIYQVEVQYLVLVQFDNYEISSFNITGTSNSTYTSSKKLVWTGLGSVEPYIFINGFSSGSMTRCLLIYGNPNSFVYDVETTCGTTGTDWVSFNIMLTKSPLIDQCKSSIIESRTNVTTNWTTQKQQNFLYFYGIQGIYMDGKLGRAHLDTNIFEVESGGDFDVGLLSIDLLCFAEAAYPTLAAWKIALIVVGCVLFVVLIGLIIFFAIKAKREKEASIANMNNVAYEMSGASLGIPASMNPVTVKIWVNSQEPIPEEKK